MAANLDFVTLVVLVLSFISWLVAMAGVGDYAAGGRRVGRLLGSIGRLEIALTNAFQTACGVVITVHAPLRQRRPWRSRHGRRRQCPQSPGPLASTHCQAPDPTPSLAVLSAAAAQADGASASTVGYAWW